MALLISTMKYLLVFAIVLFFFKISEQKLKYCNYEKERKKLVVSKAELKGIAYALIGVLIICAFAAIRANDVGTDTSGYPVSFMRIARASSSFSEMIKNSADLADEPLGALLVYVCSRVTAKSWLLLFFYQIFTIIPVWLAVLQFKDIISTTNAMAVYLFVFFNNSLNMMRQSVGCALIIYGLALIITKKKYIKICIVFLMAILFHRSSLYGIILVLATYYSFYISKKKIRYFCYLVVILIPMLLKPIAQIILKFTTDMHIVYYINVFVLGKTNVDWFVNPISIYSLVYIIVSSCLLIMPIMFESNFFKKIKKTDFRKDIDVIKYKLASFNMLGYLMYLSILFSLRTMYGIRFSIFFDYVYIFSIPLSVKKNRSKSKIMYILLFGYWFIWIMRMGWSGSSLYHIGI